MGKLIDYPDGPCPPAPVGQTKEIPAYDWITGEKILDPKTGKQKTEKITLSMLPGEGVFAPPFEAVKYLDLEFNMGVGSGVYYSLLFQLGKWGYDRHEVQHSIDVSPVYNEYYSLIMGQKEKLDSQIKNGFAALMQAVQDYELIDHDLRKYAEYLSRFQRLEKAKKWLELAKEKNNKEEIEKAEAEYQDAQHIIKAMFIDQVDAHTGDSVSLRGIAARWPTIISDFFDLYDEDMTVEDIQKDRDIPKAEAIVLKTKHDLYREWKEKFLRNILRRYKNLKQIAIGRKYSIEDTRQDLIPLLSRYRAIKDARMGSKDNLTASAGAQYSWVRPDAQAAALDEWLVWAWKPFVVKEEPYPNTRYTEDYITLKEAGFNKEERKYLASRGTTDVPQLPATPSMDRHLRNMIKQIYVNHGVLWKPDKVVEKIKELNSRFSEPQGFSAPAAGPRWEFSPYFIFLKIPTQRMVLKLANGSMLEDMVWDGIQAFHATQNIIIGHMLEREAIIEAERREIAKLLGFEELTGTGGVTKLDEILNDEYPEFNFDDQSVNENRVKELVKKKKEQEQKENKMKEGFEEFQEKLKQAKNKSKNVLAKLGLEELLWAYKSPYEKFMFERMSKMMQRGPGVAFYEVDKYLKNKAGVPGT